MKSLLQEIYQRFQADTDLSAALPGGLHLGVAPPGTEFPYATFTIPDEEAQGTFTEDYSDVIIRFNLLSDESSAQQICDLYELLKGDAVLESGFDKYVFSPDGYAEAIMLRESANLLKLPEDEPARWQYAVTYSLRLEAAVAQTIKDEPALYDLGLSL